MSFFHVVLLHRSVQTRLFFKHFYLLLRYSFLQPQDLISTRVKRAGKLLVIIGSKKQFENSNHISLEMVNIVMGDMNIVVP